MKLSLKHPALRLALLAAGLALFYWSVQAAGLDRLKSLVPTLKNQTPWFLSVYLFMCAWDVAGWQLLLPPHAGRRVTFPGLYFIRLAGEAVNNVTPFVDIGGEFLKASLVADRYRVDSRVAVASVVVGRGMLFFSEILFWVVGLIFIEIFSPIPYPWNWFVWTVALASGALGWFLWRLQRKGFFHSFLTALRSAGVNWKLLDEAHLSLREADREISAFYSGRRRRLALSFLLHLAGWAAGGLEVYVIFAMLGAPVTLAQAVIVESLLHLAKTATFFIPGNIGSQEAAMALVAQWMGFHPFVGVAASLLKRLRQLVWTGVGFGVWALYQAADHLRGAGHDPAGSLDTPLDLVIHRPLARRLARAVEPLRVLTPNALTLLSLASALAAAVSFSRGTAPAAWAGVGLFYLWAVIDHADGELARLRDEATAFGRRLDDACDHLATAAILAGIFAGAWTCAGGLPGDGLVWALVLAAGLALNACLNDRILRMRRAVRDRLRIAPDSGQAARQQRIDLAAGREPFYLLALGCLPAFAWGGSWPVLVAAGVLCGCYVLSVGVFAALRKSSASW